MAGATELPDRTATLVIGAGVLGCSIAYHLTQQGLDDVVVADRGPLPATGGPSPDAPSGVFQTAPNETESTFAQETRDLAASFDAYEETGSVEVATTDTHLEVLDRRMDQATVWGVDGAERLSPGGVADRLPLVDEDRLLGGYYVPTDGRIARAELLEALRERAAEQGATFCGNTAVEEITTAGGAVRTAVTDSGEIRAGTVVAAANVRTPSLCEMVGIDLPLVPCAHPYAVTEPIKPASGTDPGREAWLRHPEGEAYLRRHGDAVGIGNYGNEPRVVDPAETVGDAAAPLSTRSFTEEEFAPAREELARIVPALRGVDVATGVDRLLGVTPDNNPVLGETPGVDGFWVAAGVRPTHAGGAGKAVAELVARGSSTVSVNPWHVARFQPHSGSPSFLREQARDSYHNENGVPSAGGIESTGETLRESPFYRYQAALDAEFYDLRYGGWKRPMRFGTNQQLVSEYDIPERGGRGAEWSPVDAVEHLAVRDRVGMCDLTSFTTFDLVGSGAVEFGQWVFTNDVDLPVGGVTYTVMTDESGGILGDMTVVRRGRDHLHVISNSGGAGTRQIARLRRLAADDPSVVVSNETAARCGISVTGPRAREMLAPVVEADLHNSAFPFFSTVETYVESIPVLAVRVSYVGELGWELHTSTEYGAELWRILEEAGEPFGVVPFGDGALVSMRLEKGFPAYGADIDPSYTPLAAAMEHTVDFDTEFIGREALLAQREEGLDRQRTTLTLDDPDAVVGGGAPVLDGDTCLGHVTSAGDGYSVDEYILYAYLPPEFGEPGTGVEVQHGNERYNATVRETALFDPDRKRLLS